MIKMLIKLLVGWVNALARRVVRPQSVRLQVENLETRELLATYLWTAPAPAPMAISAAWNLATNWTPNGVPGPDDTAIFKPGYRVGTSVGTNTPIVVPIVRTGASPIQQVGQIFVSAGYTSTITLDTRFEIVGRLSVRAAFTKILCEETRLFGFYLDIAHYSDNVMSRNLKTQRNSVRPLV